MKEQIEQIMLHAKEEVEQASNLPSLNEVRVKYLGKKGELTAVLRGMGGLSPEERPVIGSLVNQTRDEIELLIEQREEQFKKQELEEKLKTEKIDITMPSNKESIGSIHPITQIINDIKEIFIGLGYEIAEGPEIETCTYQL